MGLKGLADGQALNFVAVALRSRSLARWGCRLRCPALLGETRGATEWRPHTPYLAGGWPQEFGHGGTRPLCQIGGPSP
jgi:hypothetical protein